VARTTFQRFFQRYWRLSGISGTLCEARAELAAVYGASVVRVPLHRPCLRRTLPARVFTGEAQRWDAVAARVAALLAQGRPVLVGTDSVADSQRLSQQLQAAGIAHRVLNALNDADEAAIVAEAGRAGRVTVATRMAGRGTDIELDAAARAAGGLHVLSCQDNASRRLDRQLAGRAGRHGDPGSAEAWFLALYSRHAREATAHNLPAWKRHTIEYFRAWLVQGLQRCAQWREERRRAAARKALLRQDLDWERRLSFAGRCT
jgi:preprotein translocase subunit SecA